jgi:peptidoglycan/LPS O-acetylase OafA/YrhL
LEYRSDIDGLRALAVLLVLVFHFNLLGLGTGGFIGVDLFFVISGYLISTIIWRALDEQRFSLGHFYAQRIRRLAPALVAVQMVVFAGAFISLLPSETVGFTRESVFAQLYVSNIYYWKSLNYFGARANTQFLLHTWSLGVEEQFYLFYPFFLMAVHRFARKHVVAVLVVATLLSFGLNILLVVAKPEAAFYLLPMRAWEMLAGALLARAQPQLIGMPKLRAVAGPVALVLIGVALATYGPAIHFPGWFALLPVVAGVLLICAGMGQGSGVSRLLSRPVPVWIGRISYPLYLVHWPINIFALTLLPNYGLVERWAMFALSFACAHALYRWVERPLRAGPWLKADRRLFAIYLASLALIMAIAGSAWVTAGWRFRFSPQVLQVADVAGTYDPVELRLDYRGGPIEPWLRPIGHTGPPPTWLVFGDSHAGAMAEASSLWLDQRKESGLVGFHNSCMPLLDSGSASCRAFNRAILGYVRQNRSIGAVLLVSIWRQPIEPAFTDADGHVVTGGAAIRAFDVALHRTLMAWHDAGVKVYIWEPLPEMPHNVPGAMVRNMMSGQNLPNSIPAADHVETFRFLTDALDREAALIAGRVQPASTLCAGGTCSAIRGGAPLFEDANHPAFGQSPYFAEILRRGMLGVAPVEGRAK